MRVLFLDTKPFNPNRYIARGVYEALRACVGVECVWAEYRTVAPLAAAGDVDLFLAFGGEEADNAAVHQAAALAGRSVIWFTEDPYEAVKNQALARTSTWCSATTQPAPCSTVPRAAICRWPPIRSATSFRSRRRRDRSMCFLPGPHGRTASCSWRTAQAPAAVALQDAAGRQ